MKKPKTNEFVELLRSTGFITYSPRSGNIIGVDKPRASAYLYCSMRTLDRWLVGEKPCPRAIALLKQKARALPDDFHDFSFTPDDKLHCSHWRQSVSVNDLRRYEHDIAAIHREQSNNALKGRYIDALRDKDLHKAHVRQLSELSAQLLALTKTPIFRLDDD